MPDEPSLPKKGKKKDGLRVPQVRILRALAEGPAFGMTRPEIAVAAKVSLSMTANIGPVYGEDCAEAEERYGKKSLRAMGYVLVREEEGQADYIWTITIKGRKALVAYDKAHPPKS